MHFYKNVTALPNSGYGLIDLKQLEAIIEQVLANINLQDGSIEWTLPSKALVIPFAIEGIYRLARGDRPLLPPSPTTPTESQSFIIGGKTLTVSVTYLSASSTLLRLDLD